LGIAWQNSDAQARRENNFARHCEPTGPARSFRPDDRLREAIQLGARELGCIVASLLAMTLVWRAQPVADAGLGEDILRPLGIGFDLLPQLPHINAQILRIGQIIP
jgi:hypothetical protein